MKNILSKIYFHPLFVLTILIFILIGRFRFISYFMMVILIHELGHILASIYYSWNIEKIIILPFGGLIKFKDILNKPIKEDFVVAISGVLFQFIIFLIIKKYISYEYFNIINYFIVAFNLLPIYPLDGSKLINAANNIFLSFYKSLNLTIIISFISIIFIIIVIKNKIIFLIIIFLFKETFSLMKDKKMLFNKFLIERYLLNINFKKIKVVKSIIKMKREYIHYFNKDGTLINEKEMLKMLYEVDKNV